MKLCYALILHIVAVTLAVPFPELKSNNSTQNGTTPLEKGGIFEEAGSTVIKTDGSSMDPQLGSRALACNPYFSNGQDYSYYITDIVLGTGLRGMVCWDVWESPVEWTRKEFYPATCLASIRLTQGWKCTEFKGTKCDHGYVASGGRLQNMRQLRSVAPYIINNVITPEEHAAINQALWEFVGHTVDGTGKNGPFFLAVKDEGYHKASSAAFFQANFIGGVDAEC